jgi:molybdopterin synthase catalytic subunit
MSASSKTIVPVAPSGDGDTWLQLTALPLSVSSCAEWVVQPQCGAVVVFSGTVRDHAEGRSGVSLLEYEAYEEHVVPKLAKIAEEARRQWPTLGRIVLIHRVGPMQVTESSVIVAVSAPHRDEAFAAARFGIDTLKATVPIWKKEHWADNADWGLNATAVERVAQHQEIAVQ